MPNRNHRAVRRPACAPHGGPPPHRACRNGSLPAPRPRGRHGKPTASIHLKLPPCDPKKQSSKRFSTCAPWPAAPWPNAAPSTTHSTTKTTPTFSNGSPISPAWPARWRGFLATTSHAYSPSPSPGRPASGSTRQGGKQNAGPPTFKP